MKAVESILTRTVRMGENHRQSFGNRGALCAFTGWYAPEPDTTEAKSRISTLDLVRGNRGAIRCGHCRIDLWDKTDMVGDRDHAYSDEVKAIYCKELR